MTPVGTMGKMVIRKALSAASRELCDNVLGFAPPREMLNILHWGVGPRSAGPEASRRPSPPWYRTSSKPSQGA